MILFLTAGACIVLVGTMAGILAREFAPAAPELASPPPEALRLAGPSPNTDGKRDKLPVTVALEPDSLTEIDKMLESGLRLDLNDGPAEASTSFEGRVPLPRPRGLARPPQQKTYTLLSEAQIAAIKTRLRLSPAQERHWPAAEEALRDMARTLHEKRQSNPAAPPPLDATADEFVQLKSAADPLLESLRDDQKRELRSLARLIGLDVIAARI
jgi:hypothetical protein